MVKFKKHPERFDRINTVQGSWHQWDHINLKLEKDIPFGVSPGEIPLWNRHVLCEKRKQSHFARMAKTIYKSDKAAEKDLGTSWKLRNRKSIAKSQNDFAF